MTGVGRLLAPAARNPVAGGSRPPYRRASVRVGLACIAGSVVGLVGLGLLGPSAIQPPLPGGGPPLSFHVDPSPRLVVWGTCAVIAVGAVGLALTLRAAARGWTPDPRRLLAAGAVAVIALVCVPTMGSGDHLSYAAYGRMVAIGQNPYTTSPDELAALGDPFGAAVEPPWQWASSVYGPVATGTHALAALLGGDSVRTTVFWLAVLNAAAFLAAGLVLHRIGRVGGRSEPTWQVRAALLWTLNPLLLYELVAGAHVDTLAVAFVVASLAAARRSAALAGALLAAGAAAKLSYAVVGGGLAWATRSARRALAALVGGGAAVTLCAYLLAGPDALNQVLRASRYVSLATPWHLVAEVLDPALGKGVSRPLISVLALLTAVAFAAVLLRGLPRVRVAERTGQAWRVALALALAYLLAAPYSLPWYDGLAWALLVALPYSRYDWLLLARTTVLALSYVPARVLPLPGDLSWMTTVLRAWVTPVVMIAIAAAVVATALRGRGPDPDAGPPAPPPRRVRVP